MRLSIAVAVCLSIVGVAAADPASAAIKKFTNIPAEDLGSALQELAHEHDFQVVYLSEGVDKLRTSGAVGDLTAEEALKKLLKGTGLAYRYLDEKTVTVRPAAGAAVSSSARRVQRTSLTDGDSHDGSQEDTQKGGLWDRFRVAQTETNSSSSPGTGEGARRADEDRNAIQEIIVTAQKKSERLQDVPVPITVLSGDQLVEQNQLQIRDYFDTVPGFTMSAVSNQNNQLLVIRGVSTGALSNPTVGVLVDDIPYGGTTLLGGGESVPDIDPGDLARIEVLRGPQGTLYGANSMGGLIKFVTVDPSTEQVSGRVQAGMSTVYSGAELGYNVRGSVNVPLTDTLAIRASGFTRKDPGYIDNPILHIDGVNKEQVSGARLSALWRPANTVSLKLSAMFQDTQQDGSSDVNFGLGLGDLQQNYPPGVGGYSQKDQAYSAILTAKFSGFDLTSLTGYNIHEFNDSWDFTPYFSSLTQKYFDGVSDTPVTVKQAIHKFSEEIRLSGSAGQRFDWLVGAFFTHEDTTRNEHILAEDQASGAIVGEWADWIAPYMYQESAAFADFTYRFTDRFDVQIGGREGHMSVTNKPETDLGLFDTVIFNHISPLVDPEISASANVFTYLLTPRFRISPDTIVYARFASGYQPGGPNTFGAVGVPPSYAPDTTRNYELGVKGDFLDHTLAVDASVYYIQWRDIQISLQTPNVITYTGNGSGAKSEGVELSVTSRPLTGLAISGWVSYDDAVLTQDFGPNSPTYGKSGDRLPNSSRWSGNFSVQQNFPVGRASGFVGGTYSYVGDRSGLFQPVATPQRQYYPSYSVIDLRAGTQFESWTVALYGSNLADKRGLIGGGIGAYPFTGFSYIRPRTIGVNLTKAF